MAAASATAGLLLERLERREWMRACVARGRRLEDDARLARVGIDREQQELGCSRAEVGGAIDEKFRLVLGRGIEVVRGVARVHGCARRPEDEVDRLVDLAR